MCPRLVLALAGLAVAAAGCGRSADGLVPVAGRVTAGGEPVRAGTVSFRPDKSKGNLSAHEPAGEIGPDGTYKLFTGPDEGAPPGWYRVAVMAGEPVEAGNASGQARWFADPKYAAADASGLAVEVVPAAAPAAYDLKLTK